MLESTCGFIERLESIGLKSPEKNPPADYWGKIAKNIYYKKGKKSNCQAKHVIGFVILGACLCGEPVIHEQRKYNRVVLLLGPYRGQTFRH